jgi:hypothetical protein
MGDSILLDNISIDLLFQLDGWTLGPLCKGMNRNLTVREIIDLWPSRSALVEDIRTEDDSVTLDVVHKWAQRNSIPAGYHALVLGAGLRRAIALTADEIVAAHARPRRVSCAQEAAE